MKIGIYSGSFNPIHNGHVALADYLLKHGELDEIWLLVSPHNPLKSKDMLIDDQQRMEMTKLALEDYPGLKASDIEFSLPQPSYTIQTLRSLSKQYPDNEFTLIIGADNLMKFHQWKDYREILNNYDVLVYPREGYEMEIPKQFSRVKYIDAPLFNISSTEIRDRLQAQQDISKLVPKKVAEYIKKNKLYN